MFVIIASVPDRPPQTGLEIIRFIILSVYGN